jgi:hypothetical protein
LILRAISILARQKGDTRVICSITLICDLNNFNYKHIP